MKKLFSSPIPIKYYLFAWLCSIVVFTVCVLLGNGDLSKAPSIVSIIALASILIGVIAFAALGFSIVFHLFKRYKLFRIVFISTSVVSIVFVIGIALLLINSQSTTETVKQNNELITCFVDGVEINATYENCQKLSIRDNESAKSQPAPIYIQTAPQIPKIEPQNVRCRTEYFTGDVVCSKSWY